MGIDLPRNKIRLLSSLYLFLVYIFGVLKFGAWSDDFWSLQDPHAHFLHAVKDGRPIYGWSIEFLFSMFNTVESLKFIRLFGLVGLLLFSDAAIRFLLSKNLPYRVVVASLVAFTLPSFQLSVHWAIAFCMGWTGFLALQGLILWGRGGLRHKFFGLLLFTVSLLIYPLLSFFVFSILFADLYLTSISRSEVYQRIKSVLPLLVLGALLSASFSRFLLMFLNLEYNPRVQLISLVQIPEKLIWFVTRPLLLSYRPFLIDSPSTLIIGAQVLIFILIFVFLISLTLRQWGKVIYFLLFLNANLVVSLLPFLVTTENQIEVRFLSSNTWLVTFLLVNFMFSGLTSALKFDKESDARMVAVISCAALLFGAYTVNDRYVNFILPIEKVSRDFVAAEILNCSLSELESGVEVVARDTPWPSRKLLGMYSQVTDLASEWVPLGAVSMVLMSDSFQSKPVGPIGWGKGSPSKCIVNLNRFSN